MGGGGGSFSRAGITYQAEEKGHILRTWNVSGVYRTDSNTAAARELARYKLDLVQKVRWDKAGHSKKRGQ
jgi:hypothetical protein